MKDFTLYESFSRLDNMYTLHTGVIAWRTNISLGETDKADVKMRKIGGSKNLIEDRAGCRNALDMMHQMIQSGWIMTRNDNEVV